MDARSAMVKLAPEADKDELPALLQLLNEALERVRAAPNLSTLEAGDLEDTLADRLEEAGVENAWDLASVFVSAGLDEAWLNRVMAVAGPHTAVALRGWRPGSTWRTWSARSVTRRDGSRSW